MLAVLVLLAGCIHDHYECGVDSDCNLGVAGRCELDRHCSQIDTSCPTGRRYSNHGGVDANTCWAGTAPIANVCAPRQPPAKSQGCAAIVCSALPACCFTGWSDACVLEAERNCPAITCDTRIAITATKAGKLELWDLTYNGRKWIAAQRADRQNLLVYLAPSPGTTAPRLAGFTAGDTVFSVGDPPKQLDFPVSLQRRYQDVSSVDFDRDLRDTVVLSSQDAMNGANSYADVLKLATGEIRTISTPASVRQTWGDDDHDTFPDAVAATGAKYYLLDNREGPEHQRTLIGDVSSNFTGAGTPGTPGTRSFDWADFDGDKTIDLIASGQSLRAHLGVAADRISDSPVFNIDCQPLVVNPSNMTCDTSGATFASAPMPIAGGGADIIAATSPVRGAYRVHPRGTTADITTIALSGPACGSACAPILAVVVRDLDGDHKLDIVAIDASLELFVGLTTVDATLSTLVHQNPIQSTTTGFTVIRTSVSGAPR